MKGSKDRTSDRRAYENNWDRIFGRRERNWKQEVHEDKVFGSFEVLTPAKQRALARLKANYPFTLESLKDDNFK